MPIKKSLLDSEVLKAGLKLTDKECLCCKEKFYYLKKTESDERVLCSNKCKRDYYTANHIQEKHKHQKLTSVCAKKLIKKQL